MTDLTQDDLDRVRKEYADGQNLTLDDVKADLEAEGFEGNSLDTFAQGIGADLDVAVSRESLEAAQRQAIDSLGSGGAIDGELVRAEGGRTIGSPRNVEQRIERTGSNSGDVIARNRNTGTEGKIGEVALPEPVKVSD